MEKIIQPKYELLFEDLKSHQIDEFIVSRKFKITLSENNYYENWCKVFKMFQNQRSYAVAGILDLNKIDNINTLAFILNLCDNSLEIEKIITSIIISLIEHKDYKDDFSDVIEAMNIAEFDKGFIKEVEIAFNNHKALKLPNKINHELTISNNTSLSKKVLKDVFIVHGHNFELKEKVARTLEKLKLNPIILHEQSNSGQTIIEKFERHSNVSFAVILLTHDDFGNMKSEKINNKRARQNVIFELGYFIGKIGRKNVMPLYENGVELPNDISGILYTQIDDSDAWKFNLVKELQSSGFDVDANNLTSNP